MRTLLLSLFLALAACSGESADSPEAEEAKFQKDFAAATEQARGRLPFFWEHFDAPLVDEWDFSLKAAIPRRDGQPGNEDVWLENIAKAPDKIVGELKTNPSYLGELRRGAIVEFQDKQIVDWSFMRGQELLGHYTTRVMLPRLDPAQAEGLRSLLSKDPDGE